MPSQRPPLIYPLCVRRQDHEGALVGAIDVRSGLDKDGDLLSAPARASSALATEDAAELLVQCALRLSRDVDEGAPPVRVLRVGPAARGTDALAERKLQNYDTEISGRARKAAKSVSSADWSVLLEPFGVVRRSDPDDRRVLIELES